MTAISCEFVWNVHAQGYVWQEQEEVEHEAFLVPMSVLRETSEDKAIPSNTYAPLQEASGLFMTFAHTPLSQGGILEFANKYGPLTRDVARVALGTQHPNRPGELIPLCQGERYLWWRREIVAMNRAVTLWRMVKEKNHAGLSKYIKWDQAGKGIPTVYYVSHPDLSPKKKAALEAESEEITDLSLSLQNVSQELTEDQPSNICKAALVLLQGFVDEHLDKNLTSNLSVNFTSEQVILRTIPSDLLSALWLQFVQAMEHGYEFRACKVCQTWYRLSPEIARTTRIFCSNACKTRDYRDRQDEARRLHAAGKPFRTIAKELGTKVAVVKKWITSVKR